MTNDIEGLLASLRELFAQKQAQSVEPGRQSFSGKDPRDPNRYEVTPNGNMVGTLIGWNRNADDVSKTISGITGLPAPSGFSQLNNQIPKLTKNGLQRMSPGVYRNKDGGLVRKVKG